MPVSFMTAGLTDTLPYWACWNGYFKLLLQHNVFSLTYIKHTPSTVGTLYYTRGMTKRVFASTVLQLILNYANEAFVDRMTDKGYL